jgi:DNA polymerase-1
MKATICDAYKLFHDGTLALSQVETNGIRIDLDYLDDTIRSVGAKIRTLEGELESDSVFRIWRKRFGDRMKLGSRQQLEQVVFGELGYPRVKGLTQSGREQADESAFDHVDLPFVKQYFKMEKLKKARNTYLAGILREVDENGFLHPVFNLHLVMSYRSSCDSPNFQNIPVRLEMIRDIIRRCFIPRKGHQIVEFDFKGIEVGISCCYHKDPTLIKYVEDKSTDMHGDTAQQLFFMTKDQIKRHKDSRHVAKNRFVFPQFYGDFYVSCARNIWEEMHKLGLKVDGVPMEEHLRANGITSLGDCDPEQKPVRGTFEYHVKTIEDSFWNDRFPVYTEWKRRTWDKYQTTGYVKFHTGFVCAGVYRRNQVLNLAIQGSAFHCLLWCLIKLQRWLVKNNMRSRIVGQIHDSMICDVHEDELDRVIAKARQIMAVDLPKAWSWILVPLEVEVEVAPPGASWLDKGRWINKDGLWQLKV